MGTGMGLPSHSIYAHELINEYKVDIMIRVNTCGAFQADLKVGGIVLAITSSKDSHVNQLRFKGMDFAPCANFELLLAAYLAAQNRGINVQVGGILSSDTFYQDDPDWWKILVDFGLLACEMESAALYTLATKFKVNALSILTVSDNIVT